MIAFIFATSANAQPAAETLPPSPPFAERRDRFHIADFAATTPTTPDTPLFLGSSTTASTTTLMIHPVERVELAPGVLALQAATASGRGK